MCDEGATAYDDLPVALSRAVAVHPAVVAVYLALCHTLTLGPYAIATPPRSGQVMAAVIDGGAMVDAASTAHPEYRSLAVLAAVSA